MTPSISWERPPGERGNHTTDLGGSSIIGVPSIPEFAEEISCLEIASTINSTVTKSGLDAAADMNRTVEIYSPEVASDPTRTEKEISSLEVALRHQPH